MQEMEELKRKIDSAKAEIAAQNKWFEFATTTANRNNAIYATNLPDTIEISPLLASYLAVDNASHLARVEKLDKNTSYGREFLKLIGSINLLYLSPTMLVHTAKAAINLVDISKQYENLMREKCDCKFCLGKLPSLSRY
jgi:hypothetical protein